MNFRKLQEISRPHQYALTIDEFIPKKFRDFARSFSVFFAVISFFISLFFSSYIPINADGLFFIFLFIYLTFFFIEVFYRSKINEGISYSMGNEENKDNTYIDLSLSKIIYKTNEIDITKALFETEVGLNIFFRLGLEANSLSSFISSNRVTLVSTAVNFDSDSVNLLSYLTLIYESDKDFKSFLSKNSINKEEFLGTVSWVSNVLEKKRRRDRFWSKENLGRIPSIGTSWSYGVTSDLGQYGLPFSNVKDVSTLDIENGYREREIDLIENILERKKESNAIIIDDDEEVALDIVARLYKKIKLGLTPPSLEHKNIFELDWTSITSTIKERSDFERQILKLFDEAIRAGNIILYIRDFPSFVSRTKTYGVNLGTLIFPYLSSSSIQIIASSTNADFHFFIETNLNLMQKFERVIPDEAGVMSSIPPLLESVVSIESDYDIYFSYPSILAIANSADKYVSYGEMPSKAIDMMVEIAPWAKDKGLKVIKEQDVYNFVSEKTGIVTGEVKHSEALKIENLEALIHKRIVGQDEAVKGITSAIRRARSGVTNPKRPLASFLFIGPTGVGKTEVSKALAESFFGDERNMIRFDMSEFSGFDAIGRLIGDFAINKTGILASRVRDNPYSVLLLDEFEKSSKDVLDLFLQIIDEGVFTDALGKEVVCRNMIIIATSNAGSEYIWEAVKVGKNLESEKDNIINKIIEEKIFKPELINRFDGTILFHPLNRDELKDIAILAISKLQKRLKEKDIELVLNDEVLNFIVSESKTGQFGGREINRIVQNKIEDLIARKIVSGEVSAGGKIEIKKEDLYSS